MVDSNSPAGVIPTDSRTTTASSNFSGSNDLLTLSPILIKTLLGSTNPSTLPGSNFLSASGNSKNSLRAVHSPSSIDLGVVVGAVIEQLKPASQSNALAKPLATQSESFSCPGGGTLALVAQDIDNNDDLNAGDEVSATFVGCKSGNQLTLNGSFRMYFSAVKFSGDDLLSFDATLTFNNFGAVGLPSYNGNARLWRENQGNGLFRNFVRYSNTTSTVGENTSTLNFDVDTSASNGSTSGNVSLRGRITVNGAVYGLQSQTSLSYPAGSQFPNAGNLRITDALGAAIVLTAKSNSVGRAYLPAGQAAASVTLPDTAWTAID